MPCGHGFGGQWEVSGPLRFPLPEGEDFTPSDACDERASGEVAALAPRICDALVVGVRQTFVSAPFAGEKPQRSAPVAMIGQSLNKLRGKGIIQEEQAAELTLNEASSATTCA